MIENFCSIGKVDINEVLSEKLDYFLSNYNDFSKSLNIPIEQSRYRIWNDFGDYEYTSFKGKKEQ